MTLHIPRISGKTALHPIRGTVTRSRVLQSNAQPEPAS
jgi:hypothetical protein